MFNAWEVAAAIMLKYVDIGYDNDMHYTGITELVLESGLTPLGLKGVTPPQTLNQILGGRSGVFRKVRRGYYKLKDPDDARRLPQVQAALAALHQVEQKKSEEADVAKLRKEVERLKQRNALLEKRLDKIAKLCRTQDRK